MGDEFQIWVDAVCEQVRFWPDRKGIEKELRIHYEDHCQALERLNYEPELAAERSLQAMGDPREVGRALNQVHRPWLGWLWEASRILLLALALLALVTLFRTQGWRDLASRTWSELDWEEPPASAAKVELRHGTLWAAPGELVEQDGHVVARVCLWTEMRRPLTARRGVQTSNFTYRDDRGELAYYAVSDPYTRSWPESRYWRYADPEDIGWTCFRQTVELVLDQPPQWVEITYPAGGKWTLRLEWGDGL